MYFQKPPLGTPLDWENPLNKGLIMHLAMNEGHGDVVQDLSMNGNHGTLNNFAFPPTVASGWNPGRTGVGLKFDGINNYVDCGTDINFGVGQSFTISMWVQPNANGDLLRKYPGGTPDYGIAVVNDKTYALWRDGVNVAAVSNLGPSILDKKYHCIIAVRDKGINKIFLYLDDNLLNVGGSVDNTGDLTSVASTVIGAQRAVSEWTDCSIDQTRMHNRAWTPKEAKDYAINPWQVYLDN